MSIFTLWFFHLYVATFQQQLQMEYTSLSWNNVRLHQDRLHEFCYPLSILCHKCTLICLVSTDCRSCHLSSLMTSQNVWHIWPAVGVSNIMVVTCGTGLYLPSWAYTYNSSFNGVPVAQTIVFYCGPLFAFSSFSFWPLSFGMLALVTNMLSSDFPYTYWVSNYHCI